jgi:hypothetical protein
MINLTKIITRNITYNLSNIKYSDIGYNVVNNIVTNNMDKECRIKDEDIVIDYLEGVSFIKDIKIVEDIDYNNI